MFPVLVTLTLVVLAAVGLGLGLLVVHEGEVAVVLRAGKFHRVARPGPTFVVPGLDEAIHVVVSPKHLVAPVKAFSLDGVRVATRLALTVRIADPLLGLRFNASLGDHAKESAAAAAARTIATLTVEQLTDGGEALAQGVEPLLREHLGVVGLELLTLQPGPLTLPDALVGALGGITVAAHLRSGALLAAETARQVSALQAAAHAEAISTLARVGRRLDDTTLELVRLRALQATAENGGQLNVVTGLAEQGLRTAIPLAPPRLRDAS